MKRYIGTKVINAKPMTRGEYNAFRGWTMPEGEKAADEGYLVEYTDGSGGNVEGFAGYVSWSPKGVFENAYRPAVALSFGMALDALKAGMRAKRVGWTFSTVVFEEGRFRMTRSDDDSSAGYCPSNADMLANDWVTL